MINYWYVIWYAIIYCEFNWFSALALNSNEVDANWVRDDDRLDKIYDSDMEIQKSSRRNIEIQAENLN